MAISNTSFLSAKPTLTFQERKNHSTCKRTGTSLAIKAIYHTYVYT